MSYAEKVNVSGRLLQQLNELVGTNPTPAPALVTTQPQYTAPQHQEPLAPPQQQSFESSQASRTHCVGGVADNTIGEIPSVKLHAAPGGGSTMAGCAGGATMAALGGMDSSYDPNAATRTRCTGGTADNTIGAVPSVKVHHAPGGVSSISIGSDINNTAAPTADKSDASALAFLDEANSKYKQQGKLAVRDFHLISSFPLFEGVYQELRISTMSYAEKVNVSGRLINELNKLVGAPAGGRAVLTQQNHNASAAPVVTSQQCYTVPQQDCGAAASRTHCVGGVADNTIGDIPSVKLHHAPGGASSIQLW
jgi:hypothetical protein